MTNNWLISLCSFVSTFNLSFSISSLCSSTEPLLFNIVSFLFRIHIFVVLSSSSSSSICITSGDSRLFLSFCSLFLTMLAFSLENLVSAPSFLFLSLSTFRICLSILCSDGENYMFFLLLFILSSSDWSSSFELLPIAFV